jgi:hypothetical protein
MLNTPFQRFVLAIMVLVFAAFLLARPVFAKDHSDQYLEGTFSSTDPLSDGTFANCPENNCNTFNGMYNIHYIRTQDGVYVVEAPTWGNPFPGNSGVVKHKQWFMDKFHEGDKVKFAVVCDKHNHCQFWFPDPDKEGKESSAFGYYRVDNAKINTESLTDTDKSKPESASILATSSSGKALIYLYRKKAFGGSAQYEKLYVNDTFLVQLHSGRHASMEVPQGEVKITSSGFRVSHPFLLGATNPNEKGRSMRLGFKVEAGKTYYIEWYLEPFGTLGSLRLVDAAIGAQELNETKPATADDLKEN